MMKSLLVVMVLQPNDLLGGGGCGINDMGQSK
jgi:hypothetical protein